MPGFTGAKIEVVHLFFGSNLAAFALHQQGVRALCYIKMTVIADHEIDRIFPPGY